jgi:hypothetical protein
MNQTTQWGGLATVLIGFVLLVWERVSLYIIMKVILI